MTPEEDRACSKVIDALHQAVSCKASIADSDIKHLANVAILCTYAIIGALGLTEVQNEQP